MKGHLYWTTAIRILRSLCDKHLAEIDPRWEGILKGGVYHVHKELGVDESVMWGEYFSWKPWIQRSVRCSKRKKAEALAKDLRLCWIALVTVAAPE